MKKCYLVDIDGTCSNPEHRIHYLQNRPKNWKAFFAACGEDKPHVHIMELVQGLALVNYVVFVSGRPESTREVTLKWLRQHGFRYALDDAVLYMRKDGDYRDDTIVKRELLDQLRADGWRPIMAFDDRDRVVKMWRDNDVPCAQVAEGNF